MTSQPRPGAPRGRRDGTAHISLVERYAAHNYHPLPVVLTHGEGAWVTDVEGRRYLDCLAGYSALNFGHGHPRLVARAQRAARAAHPDQPRLPQRPARARSPRRWPALTGKDMVLPMNTGAEAVETAVKVARKWGYRVKGVPGERGEHRRHGGQLPRPHHDHRQLLRRQGRP